MQEEDAVEPGKPAIHHTAAQVGVDDLIAEQVERLAVQSEPDDQRQGADQGGDQSDQTPTGIGPPASIGSLGGIRPGEVWGSAGIWEPARIGTPTGIGVPLHLRCPASVGGDHMSQALAGLVAPPDGRTDGTRRVKEHFRGKRDAAFVEECLDLGFVGSDEIGLLVYQLRPAGFDQPVAPHEIAVRHVAPIVGEVTVVDHLSSAAFGGGAH